MALNIDGTTGISGVDGSASAPALQGTDSNTGINFGSDTVNINTGGVTRATVDSSGRLLLGDTDADNAVSDSDNLVIGAASGDNGMTIVSQSGNFNGSIRFSDGSNTGADSYRGTIQYYHGENYMRFYTDATERMRIDSSGNIKIGESNSGAVRLSLTQASNGGLMISQGVGTSPSNGQILGDIGFSSYSDGQTNSSAEAMIRALASADHTGSSAPTDLLFFTKSSSTGPGSGPTLNMKLDSVGDLRVGRIYSNTTSGGANVRVQSDGLLQRDTSSKRYKNTITDATHGLADLNKLRSVTYKGNNDGDTIFGGLIAEEVHDAGLTEFVDYDSDNQPDALKYGNMVSLCIKAIQELSAKVETLETKVAALEAG